MFPAAGHYLDTVRIWSVLSKIDASETISSPHRVKLDHSGAWRITAAQERDRDNDSGQRRAAAKVLPLFTGL